MKYIQNKIKYTPIFFAILVLGFGLIQKAYADSYAQDCIDGGTIISVVNLSPGGPFPAHHPTASNPNTFQATAYINSTCSPRNVKVTVEDNANPIVTLIDAFIGPGISPSIPAAKEYTYPYNEGNYVVHFITAIEESLPVSGYPVDAIYGCGAPVTTYYSAYQPSVNDIEPGMDLWTDPQMQNVLPQSPYYIQSAVDSSKAYNLTNGHYTDSYGNHSTMVGTAITPC